MSIDHDRIRNLVKLVEQNGLSELSIEENGLSITIRAEQPPAPTGTRTVPQQSIVLEDAIYQESEFVQEDLEEAEMPLPPIEHHCEIRSPMVGVFYRRPSPDLPSYTEIGDCVELGQTIGLIEAMKVFSEVPSEAAGRVIALPVENAKLVQQGDILAIIDMSDTGVE